MIFPKIELRLPEWVERKFPHPDYVCKSIEERMALVIELARLNIEHRTGGPFGAAIFERESGRLISVGVNLVETQNCSIAHAEMVAFGIAQKVLQNYDLGANRKLDHELVTSTEPCAMCLGAIPWSGVRRVICGARDADARSIGFDEGDKPLDWASRLEARGIEVMCDVLRDQAREVLLMYRELGGPIYNAGNANS